MGNIGLPCTSNGINCTTLLADLLYLFVLLLDSARECVSITSRLHRTCDTIRRRCSLDEIDYILWQYPCHPWKLSSSQSSWELHLPHWAMVNSRCLTESALPRSWTPPLPAAGTICVRETTSLPWSASDSPACARLGRIMPHFPVDQETSHHTSVPTTLRNYDPC